MDDRTGCMDGCMDDEHARIDNYHAIIQWDDIFRERDMARDDSATAVPYLQFHISKHTYTTM